MSKYDPLGGYLATVTTSSIRVTFKRDREDSRVLTAHKCAQMHCMVGKRSAAEQVQQCLMSG